MSRNVFANGKEISCKKDDNKSPAAMADVCLSPPSPPAGPVPVPYPNTAEASDTTDGSKTVLIGGAEVGMKNSSSYKKSTGDEAATKSLGMGVVSHNIQGKMKHAAWSFDVMIEGANAIRHMDMTTHNHVNADNLAMTLNQAAEINAGERELTCDELDAANQEARNNEAQPGTVNTVATAYRKPAATSGRYMKAMCPHNPAPEFENGYQPPVAAQNQPECGGGRRPGYRQRNHAENKILHPEMDGQGGGMIKMSIWHPPGDAAPCDSCRHAICEAEECGIKVYLCRSSGRPPEAVRPASAGLCPPEEGQGAYDPAWQRTGLGPW
jgi:Domain of unknown function (DUF4150)